MSMQGKPRDGRLNFFRAAVFFSLSSRSSARRVCILFWRLQRHYHKGSIGKFFGANSSLSSRSTARRVCILSWRLQR